MKRFLLFFLCLLFSGTFATAQEINITHQEIANKAQFAQPFDVRFEISHTPGYQVELDKESLPKDFALFTEKQEVLSPGTVAYNLTFLPFTLGASTFTAVNFLLQNSNHQTLTETSATDTPVQVQEVEFFKDKNMRDIRPPYIPASWIWWLMSAIVLGLIIYVLRHLRKEIRAEKAAEIVQDLRPADVIALDKIHLLLQSGLWEKAQYKLFYSELGDILREYIGKRFAIDVSADTSIELLRRARKIPQLSSLQTELRSYLASADLVKFAKVIPDEPTMQKDVSCIRTVVQTTTPRPQTPAAPNTSRQEVH